MKDVYEHIKWLPTRDNFCDVVGFNRVKDVNRWFSPFADAFGKCWATRNRG
jgi:hypothetical protein